MPYIAMIRSKLPSLLVASGTVLMISACAPLENRPPVAVKSFAADKIKPPTKSHTEAKPDAPAVTKVENGPLTEIHDRFVALKRTHETALQIAAKQLNRTSGLEITNFVAKPNTQWTELSVADCKIIEARARRHFPHPILNSTDFPPSSRETFICPRYSYAPWREDWIGPGSSIKIHGRVIAIKNALGVAAGRVIIVTRELSENVELREQYVLDQEDRVIDYRYLDTRANSMALVAATLPGGHVISKLFRFSGNLLKPIKEPLSTAVLLADGATGVQRQIKNTDGKDVVKTEFTFPSKTSTDRTWDKFLTSPVSSLGFYHAGASSWVYPDTAVTFTTLRFDDDSTCSYAIRRSRAKGSADLLKDRNCEKKSQIHIDQDRELGPSKIGL